MSETAEVFKAIRERSQLARAKRRAHEVSKLDHLLELAYEVQEFTPYHFRIEGVLDIYPTNKKYHDLRTGKRGYYNDLNEFVYKKCADIYVPTD